MKTVTFKLINLDQTFDLEFDQDYSTEHMMMLAQQHCQNRLGQAEPELEIVAVKDFA
jgi:hypothetical protein